MRIMSFSLTTEQMRNRTKTQTRRLGWYDLKVGDYLRAVKKAMGRKPGEPLEDLGTIRVTDERWQYLCDITPIDVRREGFNMTPAQFVAMFCQHMGCTPSRSVHVISFEHVEAK